MSNYNQQNFKHIYLHKEKDGTLKNGKYVDSSGHISWFKSGLLHNLTEPATIWPNGRKEWYKEGELHRDNGPAIECSDGRKEWFIEGVRHNEHGHAIEYWNGFKEWYFKGQKCDNEAEYLLLMKNKDIIKQGKVKEKDGFFWYKNGKLHREGDLPAAEYTSGSKEWYQHGLLHRENKPAQIWATGQEKWWLNGQLHRLDGAAYEDKSGYKEWWIHSIEYTEEEFHNYIEKKKLNESLQNDLIHKVTKAKTKI